jgi:hypothetical protein
LVQVVQEVLLVVDLQPVVPQQELQAVTAVLLQV